jgi:hypothetical protein
LQSWDGVVARFPKALPEAVVYSCADLAGDDKEVAMKRALACSLICIGAVTLGIADRPDSAPPARPIPIVNQVIDLLDEEVTLTWGGPDQTWESRVFDASQYNRVGLRVDGEVADGLITCATSWQFTADDAFRQSYPQDYLGRFPRLVYGGSPRGPRGGISGYSTLADWVDGLPVGDRPRLDYPAYFLPMAEPFAPVYGLRAKIVCSVSPSIVGFVDIGDDPSLPGSGGNRDNPTGIGVLTDVKVLLRRE